MTVKLCETEMAAPHSLLPAWLAWMVHLPPATSVTVLPETMQTDGVVDAKLTGRPELAVALTVNGAAPYVTEARAGNVIVCEATVTTKICETDADWYCAFPSCVALMVQLPTVSRVAVEPETVQTDGVVDAKLTGSPDEAVALRLTDFADSGVPGMAAKLIV